jgi:hypothetical protein
MQPLLVSFGLAMAAGLAAQSPLTTVFFGPTGMTGGGVVFVDMTVTVPAVTITRIDLNSTAPAGTHGQVRMWQTVPGFATHAGFETTPAVWQPLGEGFVVAAGNDQPSTLCFAAPVTLTATMGARGYAFEHIGIGPRYSIGNGSNQDFASAELSVSCGAAAGGAPFADANGAAPFRRAAIAPRVWNASMHYTVGPSAAPCSYSDRIGQGCGDAADSFFDVMWTSALATQRLPGRRVTLTPNSLGSYTVTTSPSPGLLPFATHAPLPFAAGTAEVAQTLTAPFPHPTGSTSTLVIHENGMISVGSNLTYLQGLGGSDWAPSVVGLLGAPHTAWYSWHDFDLASGGQVRFAEVGSQAVLTFAAVPSFGQPGSASTLQFVFDSATGVVSCAWQTINPFGQPLYDGDAWLVGFSPGGASPRPERPTDLTTNGTRDLVATASTSGALLLTAAPRPVFGTTIQYGVGALPRYASGSAYGAPVGLLYFSRTNPFAPGLALASVGLGRPDCQLNFDPQNPVGPFGFAAPGVVMSFATLATVPSMLGVEFWVQAAVTDLAGDVFGSIVTSNALHQRVDLN